MLLLFHLFFPRRSIARIVGRWNQPTKRNRRYRTASIQKQHEKAKQTGKLCSNKNHNCAKPIRTTSETETESKQEEIQERANVSTVQVHNYSTSPDRIKSKHTVYHILYIEWAVYVLFARVSESVSSNTSKNIQQINRIERKREPFSNRNWE